MTTRQMLQELIRRFQNGEGLDYIPVEDFVHLLNAAECAYQEAMARKEPLPDFVSGFEQAYPEYVSGEQGAT